MSKKSRASSCSSGIGIRIGGAGSVKALGILRGGASMSEGSKCGLGGGSGAKVGSGGKGLGGADWELTRPSGITFFSGAV
eukprot:1005673-Rhodomonas_salina.3